MVERAIAQQWIDIPRDILRKHEQDAALVLRLGAFANATQACVTRLVMALQEPDDSATQRDRMSLHLAAVGYMKEAVDHIQHRQVRLRQLLNLAKDSGWPLTENWGDLEPLLTTAPDSIYDRLLKRVRHDLAFHFKEDVFVRWLAVGAEEQVRIWEVAGSTNAGRLYRASADALAFDLADGREVDEPEVRRTFSEVRKAQFLLLRVTEAAFFGFLVACGLNPRDHYGAELQADEPDPFDPPGA